MTVRTQDMQTVIAGIAANQAGSQVAWRFVQMHWNKLVDQFGQGNLILIPFKKGIDICWGEA